MTSFATAFSFFFFYCTHSLGNCLYTSCRTQHVCFASLNSLSRLVVLAVAAAVRFYWRVNPAGSGAVTSSNTVHHVSVDSSSAAAAVCISHLFGPCRRPVQRPWGPRSRATIDSRSLNATRPLTSLLLGRSHAPSLFFRLILALSLYIPNLFQPRPSSSAPSVYTNSTTRRAEGSKIRRRFSCTSPQRRWRPSQTLPLLCTYSSFAFDSPSVFFFQKEGNVEYNIIISRRG